METHLKLVAYLGVHNSPNLEENFKQLAECNFNTSLWIYYISVKDVNGLKLACDMASKYGILIIGEGSELNDNIVNLANEMKDQKGFLGYFVKDEPSLEEIPYASEKIKQIKAIDNNHLFYVNIYPYYCKSMLKNNIHADSYKLYLNATKDLGWTLISFDYYPITTDGLRQNWFDNIESIAKLSKECNLPWWGFILSTAHANYPVATIASMKLLACVNLAYGALGLLYFTYQTLLPEPNLTFYEGPIAIDYVTKNNSWYLVKDLNAYLKKIESIFVNSANHKVSHSFNICKYQSFYCWDLPKGISHISTHSKAGLMLSSFITNNTKYYMIVNKDYLNSVQLNIKVNKSIKLIELDTLQLKDVPSKISIDAGDCLLLANK